MTHVLESQWDCPHCGHRMLGIELDLMKYPDIPCPKCHKGAVALFELVPTPAKPQGEPPL